MASGATSPSPSERKLHFPLLADFEPKGERGPPVRRLSRARGHERARAVRHRWRRRHPLELRLADRRQPWRRRHPARARSAVPRRRPMASDRRRDDSRCPVGARDHAQGAADAPVTLVEYGDYECPYCGRAYPIVKELQRRVGRDAAVRLPELPAPRNPPARRARGRGRGGRRRAGTVLGDARRALRAPARARRPPPDRVCP